MRSFLVVGKLAGVVLHELYRNAALLNLKQTTLLKIMLHVLVLIMHHAYPLHGGALPHTFFY